MSKKWAARLADNDVADAKAQIEAAALEVPEAPAAAPEAPVEAPVSTVVVGADAHDPLAHAGAARASVLPLGTWLAAKRLRPVQTAAFSSWAGLNAPGERSADEWAALIAKFQQTPIK